MKAWNLSIAAMALVLSGCVYQSEHGDLACTVDEDCAAGAQCVSGYCVAVDALEPDADRPEGDADPDDPQVVRVVVTPASAELAIGVSLQLEATAFLDDDSELVDANVAWVSDDEAVATVSDAGVVTGNGPGTVEIVATVDDASAIAVITVLAAVDAVVIEPAAPTVGKGRTLQLVARVLDGNGDELTGRDIDWNSADDAFAEVDGEGLVTALEVGTVDISATAGGVSGTVSFEITANPVASVQIVPDSPTVELGLISEFTAELRDADDAVLDPRNHTYDWTITNASVASLSTRAISPHVARVQGQALGSTSIAVTVDGAGSDDHDIEVIEREVASVDIDPLVEPVPVGSTRQLTTQVKDPNGLAIVGRTHVWSSSDEAILTVDADGLLTARAPGTATAMVDVEGFAATLEVDTAFVLAEIVAGADHTCGLNPDGAALCWGSNDRGQLGAGPIGTTSPTPVIVSDGHVFTSLRAGDGFTCAIDGAQTAWCWGDGGRLGVPGGAASNVPVAIPTLTVTEIATGSRHGCALTSAGEVHCWGEGSTGELGDGTSTDSNAALKVDLTPSGNVTALAAGRAHTCVATDAAKTYCWGSGNSKALGNGLTTPAPTPVEVVNAPQFVQLSLGDAVSCGRTAAGDVYCWGSNLNGRLGIGDMGVADAAEPTSLGVSMDHISLGSEHGCGVNAADDVVHCWGSGTNFRLGNNDEGAQHAPVPVDGNLVGIDTSAGGAHSCAIDATNVPYCWGNNSAGRGGTAVGNTLAVPTPVWPTP